ncbi:MAG: diacylglycerol kinase family lipid kinase [Acidobacteriota bacterium]|nr:diacylglycerol kinase family lipid kinase [Acidobacteriota bacterium]
MKSRLIVNPVSGTDTAPSYLPIINQALRENFDDLDISLTIAAGDAQKIAGETAHNPDYSHIFIAGGDGTLNEVLNGVAQVKNALERITFGLIPLGTGNDFASSALGLSENIEETLAVLKKKQTIAVDVGQIEIDEQTHYFINVSAGGFIAEVSSNVDPQLKSFAGKLAYLIGGAQVLFNFEPVRTAVKIHYPDEIVQRIYEIEMFAVCNSRLIGGGQMIAPEAEIDDGLFDVCIFKDVDTFQFLNLLREISAGTHLDNEETVYLRVPKIEFEFDRKIKVNADGEVFPAQKCSYKILPRAAQFFTANLP